MSDYLFSSDYSADSLKWMKQREHLTPPVSEATLKKIQASIIADNDSALAYFFTSDYNYQPHLMQKIILDNKDAKYAFLFASSIPNCDIKALQKVVEESNKIKYICHFACFVKDAYLPPLEEMIIQSNNIKYAHTYLKHVKNANLEKFKKIILASNKPRYLFELAKHVTNPVELAQIEDNIIQLKSFTYIRLMAEKIKLSNLDKLEQAMLDLDNMQELKKFAKYVKRSRFKRFLIVA